MTQTPTQPNFDLIESGDTSYRTLQSWYLARLRAEAVELSERSRLTPMARIDTDRRAVLVRSDKIAQHAVMPLPSRFPVVAVLGAWLVLNLILILIPSALLAVASILCGLGAGVLLVLQNRNIDQDWNKLNQRVFEFSLRERIIADYSKDLVFSFDEELDVDACNMASMRLLAYKPEQLARRNLKDFCIIQNLPQLQEVLAKGKNGKEFRFELTVVGRTGTIVDLAVSAEWSNQKKLYFAIGTDMTAAKAVQRARGEFVAMISHDVRAPLQGVLFAIDTLVQTISEEADQRTFRSLSRMERNVQTVIDLIGELIDFERSSETTLNLKRTDVDIHALVDEITEQVRDVANVKAITIANEAEPVTVSADKQRLARVILNLVANALKFSPNSSQITVSTKHRDSAVEVRVTDQGAGIPKHLTGAIFERYFQIQAEAGSQDTTQNIPGSGLGLAICKAFVEAHGGLIGVESKPGEGSTFWFTLPAR